MSVETNKRLLKKYFAARYIADKGIFRYEIFCQAVQLAMEQVQEVELTVLKSKQETKIESVLIDILVLYFLEAKVIGSIVQRSSQAFVDSFFRVRILNKYFASDVVKAMDHQTLLKKIDQLTIKKIDTSIENLEKATSDFLQAGAKYGERKYFQTSSQSKRDPDFEKGTGNWEDAFKNNIVRPFIPGLPKNINNPNVAKGFPVKEGGDSPAVAILRCAFSKCTSYKQSVNSLLTLVYEEILLAILFDNEGMLPDLETDLDQIISEDKQDSIEFIYEDIRNYQALEIEKIIWIALYYKSMDMINPGYDMNQVEDPGVIKGVDNDDRHLLQNYWWARFPDPDTSLPFKNKYKLFAHFKEVYSFLQDFDIEKVITPEN